MPRGYKMMDPDLDGSLVTAESFRRQIRLLKKQLQRDFSRAVSDWMESKQELPPRAVLLTCDDDLRNTLTEMVPVLQEHGLSCLFFVTGASLGEVPSHALVRAAVPDGAGDQEDMASILDDGFRRDSRALPDKRRLWWSLVKHLSKYEATERQDEDGRR